jgi:hypothetical protein
MIRPVRPGALVILTACAIYPGLALLFQSLYPFVTGENFTLVGQVGPWVGLAMALHLPPVVVPALKGVTGLLWLAGVPGLWIGEARAYPLVLLAAVLSVLCPVGPSIMGVLALVCLLGFREDAARANV